MMRGKGLRRAAAIFLCGTAIGCASLSWAQTPPAVVVGKAPSDIAPIPAAPPARQGSPNIVLVLMDDVGFAADSTFGGPVPTPNLDALAAGGLRYNRFHTTAMCSPTRAALLTGRNHHRVEMGSIVNLAFGKPGYTGVIPDSAATIADVLRANGYATAWLGKNHLTPLWEQTAAGPFDRWPTGLGFDYFYGFMDGASDQFHPILVENRNAVDPSVGKDYILDRDLADHAINWIDSVKAAAPDKPFLLYYAPGSAHEPHQAPADWLMKFRGKFDHGYDEERRRIFARQKQLGIIPADAKLTPRPDLLPAWDSLSPAQKQVSARLMEAFAAQRAYFDFQFGRLVEHLKASGQWDNTLVIFIDGDNGASGEGGLNGTMLGLLNRPRESSEYIAANQDKIGGPFHAGNYPATWAWALDAPFPWFKQHASYLGGTRAGMVVSWPARIAARGELRTQYGHVNDIAPTLYEAAGVAPPKTFSGIRQLPIDGTSLVYSFANASAHSRHKVQYYEMLGNVGIYKDGWLANMGPPNVMFAPSFGRQKSWQLYNLDVDYSQSTDLAAQYPDKLKALKAEWQRQQKRNGFVWQDIPISARSNPANRPDPFAGPRMITLLPGSAPLPDGAFPDIMDRAWSLSVEVEVTGSDTSGTIISQGGYPFGWGLYVVDGRPAFLYVNQPEPTARLASDTPLSPGKHVIEIGMAPTGKGPGGPAQMRLTIDGISTQTLSLARTVPASWGANGVGVAREVGTVMLPDMTAPFPFSGRMGPVKLKLQ